MREFLSELDEATTEPVGFHCPGGFVVTTVKRYYYETHAKLKEHLNLFLTAYNFAGRLKRLKGLTTYEYIVKCWQNDKERFKINPSHYTLGLST